MCLYKRHCKINGIETEPEAAYATPDMMAGFFQGLAEKSNQ